MRRWLVVLVVLAAGASLMSPALGHDERDVTEPEGAPFPTYRQAGPAVVVCKPGSAAHIAALPAPLRARNEALLEDCRFEHIQEAVNFIAAAGVRGSRILVLPGVYREEPSRHSRAERFGAPLGRDDLIDDCRDIVENDEGDALVYDEEILCPHLKNLVAVQGDATPGDDSIACDSSLCDLQIEGTGGRPADVIVDGKFRGFDNGIKADRAEGFYVRNMAFQHFGFNGVYIIETAAATVESAEGNYNHEYGFLSFLAHVLYENCEGRSNGDGMVYPGASPNLNATAGLIPEHRDDMTFSTHVRGCRGHHNEVGFSGTSGNSVWIHHNEWDHNIAGVNLDSFFPDHPGTPQNHALVEDNVIHSNNSDYYDVAAHEGVCSRPMHDRDYEDGALCPLGPAMTGSGVINPGGNFNWYRGNRFYDNWRTSVYQLWVPAELREGEQVPEAHFRPGCGPDGDRTCPFEETSHWNTYSANRLAEQVPFGYVQPNGADFMWDLEGEGNCWAQSGEDANTSAAGEVTFGAIGDDGGQAPVTPPFPDCTEPRETDYSPISSVMTKSSCATYDQADNPDPPGCDFVDVPAMPDGREPETATLERLAGADRIETAVLAAREGYPQGAPTVVLARADLYAEALAGAPLAHARGGPLLLTGRDGLDGRTAAEIERLGATTAVLLGGTAALPPQVEQDLGDLGFDDDDVVRIAGSDRYGTAAAIARALPATDALLVRGEGDDGWADALAASAAAALVERPILLTAGDHLPAATADLLADGGIEAIDIVGGTAAVSEAVARQAADHLDEVERIAGRDRYETSLAVAKWSHLTGADPAELWLATGTDWADGTAAGSAIAVDEGVLLLVDGALEGTPVSSWLDDVHPYYDTDGDPARVRDVLANVRILGGTAAVPGDVEDDLRDGYGAQPGDARGDRSVGNTLLHGRLEGGGVSGSATVTERYLGTTDLAVAAAGLTPDRDYEAHVSTTSCPGGPDLPLAGDDSLHVALRSDSSGVAIATDTAFAPATTEPRSVTIHEAGHEGEMVACADLAAPIAGMCHDGDGTCGGGVIEPESPDDFDTDRARSEAQALLGLPEEELPDDVRVSRRGDEHFILTEDYVLGRNTVELDQRDGDYIVTSVTVELPDGPETFTLDGS